MNKKGQVLVTFLCILPLLLTAIVYSIDYGMLINEKRKIESNMSTTLHSALDHLDYTEEELKNYITTLLNKNIKDIKTTIQINQGIIKIQIQKEWIGLWDKILSTHHVLEVRYIGYIEHNKKIIQKE